MADITVELGGTKKFHAAYVDAQGNPTAAPAGVPPFTWTLSDAAAGTVDTTTGPDVVFTPTGPLGATATVSASDGTLTSAPDTITIVAGPAAGIAVTTE